MYCFLFCFVKKKKRKTSWPTGRSLSLLPPSKPENAQGAGYGAGAVGKEGWSRRQRPSCEPDGVILVVILVISRALTTNGRKQDPRQVPHSPQSHYAGPFLHQAHTFQLHILSSHPDCADRGPTTPPLCLAGLPTGLTYSTAGIRCQAIKQMALLPTPK